MCLITTRAFLTLFIFMYFFQASKNENLAETARDILLYVMRDLSHKVKKTAIVMFHIIHRLRENYWDNLPSLFLSGWWFLLCWRCRFPSERNRHSQERRSLLRVGGGRDKKASARRTNHNEIWRERPCVVPVLEALWGGEWGKCQSSSGKTSKTSWKHVAAQIPLWLITWLFLPNERS